MEQQYRKLFDWKWMYSGLFFLLRKIEKLTLVAQYQNQDQMYCLLLSVCLFAAMGCVNLVFLPPKI